MQAQLARLCAALLAPSRAAQFDETDDPQAIVQLLARTLTNRCASAQAVMLSAAAPVVEVEEEGPVAALVRRVTEQIQEAVEAKTEASPASPTEAEAPVRRKTQLSLHVPGYAPYGYGYPPHPYQYAPPQPYAQPPQQGQMPPPPPYPYYYAPPPPPHGYWAPPHAPMTVQQGAYYPGASVPTASSASVSSASQTE